jgi:hypothetical protein
LPPPANKWPLYLDQNVFGHLIEEGETNSAITKLLRTLHEQGAIIAFSSIHVEECRAFHEPAKFVRVLESLDCHFIERKEADASQLALTPEKAADLILREADITDEAAKQLGDLLLPVQFARGWLGDVEAEELREEIFDSARSFWKRLASNLPEKASPHLEALENEMLSAIRELPLTQMMADSNAWANSLSKNPNVYFSQIDGHPPETKVSFILSQLSEAEQIHINDQFPAGFWSTVQARQEGNLAGFSFMLFLLGLTRSREVGRKHQNYRRNHFLRQFRDCQHIEEASRCTAFVTFDEGAAKLAKAVYAYAGVATEVCLLRAKSF